MTPGVRRCAAVARAAAACRDPQPARRRRVRRGLAQGRHAAQQAERVRRLHRGGAISDRSAVDAPRAARHPRRLERRAPGRRRDHPGARAVRRGRLRRAAPRHGPLPPVRLGARPGSRSTARPRTRSSSGPARVLAVPPGQGRRRVPGDPDAVGRQRRPRRSDARAQVHRRDAARDVRRARRCCCASSRTPATSPTGSEAQNKVTYAYLEAIPEPRAIEKRLTELWNYEKYSAPFKVGGRYFYSQERRPAEPVGPLHPGRSTASRGCCSTRTRWSKDGTVALAGTGLHRRRQAAGLRRRRGRLRLEHLEGPRRRDRQAARPTRLKWVKFSGAVVDQRRQGLLLQPLPRARRPARSSRRSTSNQKLYYHKLGTPQTEDMLVYERPDHPNWGFGGRRHRRRPLPRHLRRRRHHQPQEPRLLQGPDEAEGRQAGRA